MSYNNQQPPYGGPPPAHSPHPGYGQQGPPPPQSHSPYPPNQQAPMYSQQQQWPAPPPQQGQWVQQPPYNQPPPQQQQSWSQPPPQQQHWHQPPPQHQQHWDQQPPQHYGQQPPQHYGQQQQQQQQQPGGWGAPPPGQYQPPPQQQGYGVQVRPTGERKSFLGRVGKGVQALTAELKGSNQQQGQQPPLPGSDHREDAARIRDALKGARTDEETLSLTLAAMQHPSQMDDLRQTYDKMYDKMYANHNNLMSAIKGRTSGSYEELCTVLIRLPAEGDAYFVQKAISRPGTSEDLLNDVLLGRTNREIYDMKQAYRRVYGSNMRTDVGDDLSMKTKDLFMLVLDDNRPREEEYAPCIPQNIQRDVADLKSSMRSTIGGLGKDTNAVCAILAKRSNGQLRAINLEYSRVHGNGALEKDIKKKFSGHMEDALLLMLARGIDPVKAEATQLEKSMKGMGTNEALLTHRTVALHWNEQQLAEVRIAYKQLHGKSLYDRVKGETSGGYEKLLLELLYPGTWGKSDRAAQRLQAYRDKENGRS